MGLKERRSLKLGALDAFRLRVFSLFPLDLLRFKAGRPAVELKSDTLKQPRHASARQASHVSWRQDPLN